MSNGHRWGDTNARDERTCTNAGCTVRSAQDAEWWQRKKGGHWRPVSKEPIPECIAKEKTT